MYACLVRKAAAFAAAVILIGLGTACGWVQATAEFPPEVYPRPIPAKLPGFSLSSACPYPGSLEKVAPDLEEVLAVVTELSEAAWQEGDLSRAKRAADPAFWPVLERSTARGDPQWIDRTRVADFGPARVSPYAELIANVCGKDTLDRSWWIALHPAGTPLNGRPHPALIGHFYLIKRQGRWLVWAAQ